MKRKQRNEKEGREARLQMEAQAQREVAARLRALDISSKNQARQGR